jgi:hypothetical protein
MVGASFGGGEVRCVRIVPARSRETAMRAKKVSIFEKVVLRK